MVTFQQLFQFIKEQNSGSGVCATALNVRQGGEMNLCMQSLQRPERCCVGLFADVELQEWFYRKTALFYIKILSSGGLILSSLNYTLT